MTCVLAVFLLPGFQTGPEPAGRTFYCDPVRGDRNGDGSAERPWRTVEEVLSARRVQIRGPDGRVANADAPVRPGDTILLRTGYHGEIRIASGYNDAFVTIAAEKGHFPQVSRVEIGGGRRWRIRGLTVSPSLAPVPPARPPADLVVLGERGEEDSAELVVEDCFVYGVLDASGWGAKDWVERPPGGIWLGRHGKGHVARNNYVLNTRFGINLCAPGVVCEGNVVDGFSGDGIRVTRDGQVVQYNVVRNNYVGDRDGDDNHDDGIQAFLFNRGTGTLRGVTVRGNLIVHRDAPNLPFPNPLQGIGFFDGPLVDFTVEKNVVLTNHWHGVSLYDAQNCRIEENACFSLWTREPPRPWIMVGGKRRVSRGNTVRNNLAHSFHLGADPEVKAENNRPVTAEAFYRRMGELLAAIEEKFGKTHPVAQRPRLVLRIR